jgi:hypothetical protein
VLTGRFAKTCSDRTALHESSPEPLDMGRSSTTAGPSLIKQSSKGELAISQPGGFYVPSQLVQDAKRHGVDVRPVDDMYSDWAARSKACRTCRRSGWRCARVGPQGGVGAAPSRRAPVRAVRRQRIWHGELAWSSMR